MKTKRFLLVAGIFVALVISCSSSSNNDDDPSSSSSEGTPSSSSSDETPSSSSSEGTPSSSSVAPSSSSALSSSSVEPSSSSATQSSSSAADGPCAGFVEGTIRINHYGKDKPQFCDERDGKKYVYATIGTQIWMAENLNYDALGSKCGNTLSGSGSLVDDNTSTCDTYGRLYNWNTAMNNFASSNAVPSGVQGVCPSGWHLPSDDEWAVLETAVGGSSLAGRHLKATSGWIAYGEIQNLDTYSFAALSGGLGLFGFNSVGYSGYWWSATEDNAGSAWYRNMDYEYEDVDRSFNDKSISLFSVRCLKDEPEAGNEI